MPTQLTNAQYDMMDVELVDLSYDCDENGNETATGTFYVTVCYSCADGELDSSILLAPAAMASHPDLPQKGDVYSRPAVPAMGIDAMGEYCPDASAAGCTPCTNDMGDPAQCVDVNGFPVFIIDETQPHPVDDLDKPGMIVKNVKVGSTLEELSPTDDDFEEYGKNTQCRRRSSRCR